MTHKSPCPRCAGDGRISAYTHVKAGVCFRCGGAGTITTKYPPRAPSEKFGITGIQDGERRLLFWVKARNEADALKKASRKPVVGAGIWRGQP